MSPVFKASPEVLRKQLKRKPLLWVGAGLSVAAGLPGTDRLIQKMVEEANRPLDASLSFEKVADAFIASTGKGALGDLLQRELAEPGRLTPAHKAIARATKEGDFPAIVTTNYDDLLERALADEGVRIVHQALEDNSIIEDAGAVRLLKLHGSKDDWKNVVLSGQSYERFSHSYPFLQSQLEVRLRRHPVLFVGCSLLDPRILKWLEDQDEETLEHLKPWQALIREKAWQEAVEKGSILKTARVTPLILDGHEHLQEVWTAAVPESLPQGEMAIEVKVKSGDYQAQCRGESWSLERLLDNTDWLDQVKKLRKLANEALPADDHGTLAAAAAHEAALIQQLAVQVGERLTALLPQTILARLTELEATARSGSPVLLRLKVEAVSKADAAEADRLLSLPWELLRVADRFPVEENTVDLVREAVVQGLEGIQEPKGPLKMVASVASPIDQVPLDYEGEMYRLWRALGAQDEGRLKVTDLGTLGELGQAVEEHDPTVVHFTGHGIPGGLIFEDYSVRSREVDVEELIKELHVAGKPLPRLIYLSACHGTTAAEITKREARQGSRRDSEIGDPTKEGNRAFDPAPLTPRPSTAAALHRGGFSQVVGYFGPVGDAQATRTAAYFYRELAKGSTARDALRRARNHAARPLSFGGVQGIYPLGWAQLSLYHRGEDHATAKKSVDTPFQEVPKERLFHRMDHTGKTERVERRHDEPVVGIQQLRHGFIGRRSAKAVAISRWRHHRQQLLVIYGLGGLGKTTLCAELLRILPKGKVLALDGRFAGAQDNPFSAFWSELEVARSHDEKWPITLGELQEKNDDEADALAQAIDFLYRLEGGLTVYLDDAESLQEELPNTDDLGRWKSDPLKKWWRSMVQKTDQEGFGLIASSRFRPEGTKSGILALEPMSQWEILRLMSWMPTLRALPHDDRDWLAKKVAGHPRTVEWLEVLASAAVEQEAPQNGAEEIKKEDWRPKILEPILKEAGEKIDDDLLLEQIWNVLDSDSRDHLGRASVLSRPAPWDLIRHLESASGTGLRLRDAGLLSPFQSLIDQLEDQDLFQFLFRCLGQEIRIHPDRA